LPGFFSDFVYVVLPAGLVLGVVFTPIALLLLALLNWVHVRSIFPFGVAGSVFLCVVDGVIFGFPPLNLGVFEVLYQRWIVLAGFAGGAVVWLVFRGHWTPMEVAK